MGFILVRTVLVTVEVETIAVRVYVGGLTEDFVVEVPASYTFITVTRQSTFDAWEEGVGGAVAFSLVTVAAVARASRRSGAPAAAKGRMYGSSPSSWKYSSSTAQLERSAQSSMWRVACG